MTPYWEKGEKVKLNAKLLNINIVWPTSCYSMLTLNSFMLRNFSMCPNVEYEIIAEDVL